MSLSSVAAQVRHAEHRGRDVEVVDATHDSRQVVPGALFCAIPGTRVDGHEHAPAAVRAGASALLVERWLDLDVPQVKVPSVRAATGPAAAAVHGHPSHDLTVVGITGTNGKTTTAYLLEGAFAAAGQGTGVIGTIETRIHGTRQPGQRTTPEGTDLQRMLRTMHTRGVDAVAMEVSSHGLDLRRVDGTRFAVAVYTNLSQDHLDWHVSMEAYLTAKARLFARERAERGVVYLDGPWAQVLLDRVRIPVTTVGRDASADVRIVEETTGVGGSHAVLRLPDRSLPIATTLPGRFNLANAATAVVAALAAGVPAEAASAGVAACSGAPGRLERVPSDAPFTVFVDYAHTPDAVTQVIDSVRDAAEPGARVIVVLGAGGERDRQKRGPMGAAAAQADLAVLTSDNPRTEDPKVIVEAVAAGAQAAVGAGARAEVIVELDRGAAIGLALAAARDGDVVVIAGKGHEAVQEIDGRVIPFDDRLVAARLLAGGAA